jgi:DegV family protein with EDD domain
MALIKIVTDSTADIPDHLVAELEIDVIHDYINFGTQSLRDKLEITRKEFYSRLAVESETPTTASPGVGEFEELYRKVGAPEVAVISLHPPARFSALFNTAALAARSFPEGCVTVIDTGQLSMGLGWMVIAAAKAAKTNQSVESIVEMVSEMMPRTGIFAALDTFEFLRRSGRVSWAHSVVGTLLRIKPMIELREGQILPRDRVRTSRQALARLVGLTEALGPLESLAVLHSNWPAGAEKLHRRLDHLSLGEPIFIVDVTPVIGVHVGPGGLGIAAVGKAPLSAQLHATVAETNAEGLPRTGIQ